MIEKQTEKNYQYKDKLSGFIVHEDDELLVVRVSTMEDEMYPYTLFYNEVENRVCGFDDTQYANTNQRYFCVDKATGESLFHFDELQWEWQEIVVDDDGKFIGYEAEEAGIIPTSGEEESPENYRIDLPQSLIEQLENEGVITEVGDLPKADGSIEHSCGISRALTWLTDCDCAFISAWRGTHLRKVKDADNKTLQQTLRNYGYGVAKVIGHYPEIKSGYKTENSFLVWDLQNNSELFLERISELSARYEQDSFLYKKAGRYEPAYTIGSNKDKGIGTKELAGRLHIGNMSADTYTKIGSSRLTFE